MESKAEKTFVRNDNFYKLLVKNEVYLKGSKNNFTIFIFSYHVQLLIPALVQCYDENVAFT